MLEHYEKKKIKNILVVAITRMGDMLQSSPTLVGLKSQYPDARVTVVIDTQFAPICKGIPGIDEVFVLDLSMVVRCIHRGGDGIVEAYRYVTKAVEELRERKFDYCLNMSSSSYTAILLKILDIPESRGWMSDEEGYRIISDPWAMLFAAFVYHSNRDYNSLNLVDIFRCAAGVKEHPLKLAYNPTAEELVYAKNLLVERNLVGDGPLIAIQAGASQTKRQWPSANFAKVVELLVQQLNARVLLVGSGSERPIIDDIMRRYPHQRVATSAGSTNFGELGALLQQVDLLITGDTGPMHMAVAVGTPVVAMFLASALCFETGPYSSGNFVMQPNISCNPCNPNFPCSRPDCHAQISPELVVYLTKLLLETPRGKESEVVLPLELQRQQGVSIYVTQFDADNFLEFRQLAGAAPKEGLPAKYYQSGRAAYRALWKEEFEKINYKNLPPLPEGAAVPLAHPSLAGVQKAIELSREGSSLLRELERLVKNVHGEPAKLREVNQALTQLDSSIEEIGLSYPLLGALIRIFIMEKENLRGEDVLFLASETRRLYEQLARRGKRFAQLYEHFQSGAGN